MLKVFYAQNVAFNANFFNFLVLIRLLKIRGLDDSSDNSISFIAQFIGIHIALWSVRLFLRLRTDQ